MKIMENKQQNPQASNPDEDASLGGQNTSNTNSDPGLEAGNNSANAQEEKSAPAPVQKPNIVLPGSTESLYDQSENTPLTNKEDEDGAGEGDEQE